MKVILLSGLMVWLYIYESDLVIWFVVWLVSPIFAVESDVKIIYFFFVVFYYYFESALFK